MYEVKDFRLGVLYWMKKGWLPSDDLIKGIQISSDRTATNLH